MRLGNIKATPGSTKSKKRVGRGAGSGKGKTSGKGHKGQRSRSGFNARAYHEGGQMPLQRRIPKRGFVNIFKVKYQPVNLSDLSEMDKGSIGLADIYEAKLARKTNEPVKILGDGELTKAINVTAHAFSKTAKEKIEAVGGKVEVIK